VLVSSLRHEGILILASSLGRKRNISFLGLVKKDSHRPPPPLTQLAISFDVSAADITGYWQVRKTKRSISILVDQR
jgi:hypothetical protein